MLGIQVVIGDCLNLPFKDKAFDVICISGVLHHLPHQLERAFSEIGRCTKKAVCMIEASATKPLPMLIPILSIFKAYKLILDKLYSHIQGKYTHSIFEKPLSPNKLIQLCKREGFVISEIKFFNHIPMITFLPETLRKHLVYSMISLTRGTDVEIIAVKEHL